MKHDTPAGAEAQTSRDVFDKSSGKLSRSVYPGSRKTNYCGSADAWVVNLHKHTHCKLKPVTAMMHVEMHGILLCTHRCMAKMSCMLRCVTKMSYILGRRMRKMSHVSRPIQTCDIFVMHLYVHDHISCICTCVAVTRLSLQRNPRAMLGARAISRRLSHSKSGPTMMPAMPTMRPE